MNGLLIPAAIVAALLVIRKMRRAPGPRSAITGGAPATPQIAPQNDPITEAAYNQQPTEMGDAFGPDENTSGEEVIHGL